MTPVTPYRSNRSIKLLIDNEGIEAIKHLVQAAPEETQWFHTVKPLYNQPNEVLLQLSTRLYIPKQKTSSTEVSTTSEMMVDFYNELKSTNVSQAKVNEILSTMNCWCHSHHNMAPNPSGQDNAQFANLVKMSQDQSQNTWQIMLIFNKQNQFYSRVYDPNSGIVWEGVELVTSSSYDFGYIDEALKTKLQKQRTLLSNLDVNLSVATEFIQTYYSNVKRHITPKTKAKVPNVKLGLLQNNFSSNLYTKEYVWLLNLLHGRKDVILKTIDAYLKDEEASLPESVTGDLDRMFAEYFLNTKDTLSDLSKKLELVFDISECSSKEEIEYYLS